MLDVMNDMYWNDDEENNLKNAIKTCKEAELHIQDESTFTDNVNHPCHYASGGVECIEAIKSSMSEQEFKGYLKGNILKYIWRYDKKNGKEDLEKAEWYLKKLIENVNE